MATSIEQASKTNNDKTEATQTADGEIVYVKEIHSDVTQVSGEGDGKSVSTNELQKIQLTQKKRRDVFEQIADPNLNFEKDHIMLPPAL
ncbi:hypothetical protein HOLleu_38301 [Holothuria leucospilota]|uniref:Uncharacterized protein n=1 Tax=Holothuria leucospilota TaxID=206669 RepID=A0A9Q1BF59_HOLLE|nr:hypothetical protein HOLleu_38301 [Holothuria leucospilota]